MTDGSCRSLTAHRRYLTFVIDGPRGEAMGPILTRELVTAARRRRTYFERAELAILFALLVAGVAFGSWMNGVGTSYRELRRAALQVFGLALFGQMTVTLMYLPQALAGALAGERDKQTLGSLLGTTLSSRAIVL